jgi:predicted HicB family RNase H-like nuclease
VSTSWSVQRRSADLSGAPGGRTVRVSQDLWRAASKAAASAGYRSVDVYVEDALAVLVRDGRPPWD